MATRFKKIFINTLLSGITKRGVFPQSYKGHASFALEHSLIGLEYLQRQVLWEIVTKESGASEGARVLREATTLCLNEVTYSAKAAVKRKQAHLHFAGSYVRKVMENELRDLDRELREWVETNKPSLSETEAQLRSYLQKFELQGGIQ